MRQHKRVWPSPCVTSLLHLSSSIQSPVATLCGGQAVCASPCHQNLSLRACSWLPAESTNLLLLACQSDSQPCVGAGVYPTFYSAAQRFSTPAVYWINVADVSFAPRRWAVNNIASPVKSQCGAVQQVIKKNPNWIAEHLVNASTYNYTASMLSVNIGSDSGAGCVALHLLSRIPSDLDPDWSCRLSSK